MSSVAEPGIVEVEIVRFRQGLPVEAVDTIAVEEPLEIQVRAARDAEYRPVCMTMRTPGHDAELAAGFLFNEAVIAAATDIRGSRSWGPFRGEERIQNICRIDLNSEQVEFDRLERHFYTNSSCGVCGRASLGALIDCVAAPLPGDGPLIAASLLLSLPGRLRTKQDAFECTGGLHATALFDVDGSLQALREDVGRHNAMDKVAGYCLVNGLLPASGEILIVSGRLSFELVQKAMMMGVPVLGGIGAPSSLAIELARKTGLTLVGFVREDRFNVYANDWRIVFDD